MVQIPCLGILLVSHVNQVIQHLFLSYYFLAEFPSGAWVPTKPANFAWASKIGPGGLSASSPSGEREDACGLRRWWLVFHVNQVIQPLFLSYYFLAEFPPGAWVPTMPANFAWASKIGPGGLSASSRSGEWEDACSLCRWWLVFHVNQVIQPLFLC